MRGCRILAMKYLQKNKRRTAITIIGITLSVIVLYTIINLSYSYILTQRENIRKEGDYEIVLLTDNTAVANQTVIKDYVVSVNTGMYYHPYLHRFLDEPVLFVKVDKPEKAYVYKNELEELYDVEAICNEELLGFYLQGDSSSGKVIVLTIMLFVYAFAVFSVGMIRNSVQLTILEQMKDFGILRCIGATRMSVRFCVYWMGAILEMAGVLFGIIIGYPVSQAIADYFQINLKFRIWFVFLIILIFLADLFFVMWEQCENMNRIALLEIVHGQIQIQKEKIKKRRIPLIQKIFGVEGTYAYKSLCRYPGRFYKSVGAITFGIGIFVVVSCIWSTIYGQAEANDRQEGYYQVCCYLSDRSILTTEELNEKLPNMEILNQLMKTDGIEVAKKLYCNCIYTTNVEEIKGHIREAYQSETGGGELYAKDGKKLQENVEDFLLACEMNLFGMDEEDISLIDSKKVDGTLEVSENGIILFNRVYTMIKENDSEGSIGQYKEFEVTDYKVGDKVQIVEPTELVIRYQKKIEEGNIGVLNVEETTDTINSELLKSCVEELVKEGKTKTFTIEAVVNDTNNIMPGFCSFALPLKRYSDFMKRDESVCEGIKFRVNYRKNLSRLKEFMEGLEAQESEDYVVSSSFVYTSEMWRKLLMYTMPVIVLIVVMSCLNIINTTAGNLYLRRQEFGQLWAIGFSKGKLYYAAILEGVFTLIIAGFWGLILGYGIGRSVMSVYTVLLGWKFYFSVRVFLICVVVFGIVLCATEYCLIREMLFQPVEVLDTKE